MEVIVHSNREVCPNRLFVGNQYENKIEKVKFNFPDYEGYHYLIINKSGESYAVPLLDDVFYVDSLLTFKSGIYESHAVISGKKLEQTTEIDGSVLTFISNPISLIVKRNKINAGSLSEAPLPQNLQIVYDQLFNTYEQIKSDYDSGAFDGKDGYSPTLDVTPIENGNHITINDINGEKEIDVTNGIDGQSAYELAVKNGFEGTEQEWLESLKYDHSEEFKQLADQVKQDANSAADSATKAESAMNEANTTAQANVEAINKASTDAQNAITTFKGTAVKSVQDAQSTAENAIDTAKASATQAITEQKENVLTEITQEKNSATEAIETAKDNAIEEIENTGVPLEEIEKLAVKETATGNPTIISDSAEWRLQKLNIFGQSEQESTTGAQLFDFPKFDDMTNGSVTISRNDDGSIFIDGSTTEYTSFFIGSVTFSLPVGEYYLTCRGSSLIGVQFIGDVGADLTYGDMRNKFSITEDKKSTGLFVVINGAYSGKATIYPMISLTETAEFEPYTGGKPSPSPDYPQEILSKEVNEIKVTGKNLNDGIKNDFSGSTNGQITSSALGSIVVPIIGGETYTISVSTPQIIFHCTTKEPPEIGVSLIDSYAGSGGLKVSTKNMSTKKEAKYLIININDSDFSILQNAQVEIGSNATSYEPYKSQTITLAEPITLRGLPVDSGGNVTIDGQQYISDVITEKDGVIGVERKLYDLSLTSSLQWTFDITTNHKNNNFQIRPHIDNFPMPILNDNPNHALCLSNYLKFTAISYDDVAENLPKIYTNASIYNGVEQGEITISFPPDSEFNTLESFKNWLDEKSNVKVIYIVNEPTFEPLPEEVQAQYKALKSYYPNTVIQTGCWNEVEYVADTKTWLENKINGVTELALGIGGK